jgi:electron transport complex protein RnfA
MNVAEAYNFIESIIFGLGSGIGFSLAMVIMASIREKLELADVPRAFQGLPISFILTGLIALAFLGFSGLIKL